MPEMRAEDGKNRKHGRAAPEKVPALRRQSGSAFLGPRDPVQGLRLVRHGLRRKKVRRRCRERRQARGGIERVSKGFQGFEREGISNERFRNERFRKQREENRQIGKIGEEEIIQAWRLRLIASAFSNSYESPRLVLGFAARVRPWLSGSRVCRRRRRKCLRRCRPIVPALAPTCAGRR